MVGKSFSCTTEDVFLVNDMTVPLVMYKQCTLVILCYYNAEVILLRQLMLKVYRNMDLDICSIEAFQGYEANFSLLSTCAQEGKITPHLKDEQMLRLAGGNLSFRAIDKPY